jgi:hypothetical protein
MLEMPDIWSLGAGVNVERFGPMVGKSGEAEALASPVGNVTLYAAP